jgi:type I restriction enzyme S subunit
VSGGEVLPLGQVVKPTRPRVKPSDYPDLPFIGMEHVEAHSMKLLGTVPAVTMKSAAVHFKAGDVLYGRLRPYLNKVYRPAFEGLCSAEFIVLPENERVNGGYLQYFLNSPAFVRYASHLNTGDRPRVDFDQLAPYGIPLPDVDEQHRIVAEIEKQFSRRDEAVADLKRVKANLRRHHVALLRAALEGKLVPAESELAAREGRDFESSVQLVRRVLDVHREAWRGKGRYIAPEHSVLGDLPELPSGWTWIRFGLLGRDPNNTVQTGPFGAQLHNTEFKLEGVPVIAVGNLPGTGFTPEGTYFVDDWKAAQLSRYDVWAGDLLFARSGATLGKVCVAPEYVRDWRMTGHILRARLNTEFILPQIAVFAIAALPAVREQVFGSVRGVTRPGFNTSLLESIFIPVPPIAEQWRIVAEVDRRLSIAREVEAEVDANLRRAQALRQAVLARAFSGEPLTAEMTPRSRTTALADAG